MRYLAGRFPETLSATDDDGRTPLHYAATLKDNGHFYNLLTHLGANPKVEDSVSMEKLCAFNHSTWLQCCYAPSEKAIVTFNLKTFIELKVCKLYVHPLHGATFHVEKRKKEEKVIELNLLVFN